MTNSPVGKSKSSAPAKGGNSAVGKSKTTALTRDELVKQMDDEDKNAGSSPPMDDFAAHLAAIEKESSVDGSSSAHGHTDDASSVQEVLSPSQCVRYAFNSPDYLKTLLATPDPPSLLDYQHKKVRYLYIWYWWSTCHIDLSFLPILSTYVIVMKCLMMLTVCRP